MAKKSITFSIRLDLPDGSRFGPGKAALLEAIAKTGSISAAAKQLSMSYPRALRLVNEMNAQFSQTLVEKYQGGNARGGAELTKLGHDVLETYREIESSLRSGARDQLKLLKKFI